MDSLYDTLEGLHAQKITERNNHVSKFKGLLENAEVIKGLDCNSLGKNNNQSADEDAINLDWSYVFKQFHRYMLAELETILKFKPTEKATTVRNREKKLHDLASLHHMTIEASNRRVRCLPVKPVLEHIIVLLNRDDLQSTFGPVCSNILRQVILPRVEYITDITEEDFCQLIKVYIPMCSPELSTSHSVSTMHCLITTASLSCALPSSELFQFFESLFASNACKDANFTRLGFMVESLIVFCRTVAIDCRRQVCRLGEIMMNELIRIWHSTNTGHKLRNQLIDFFHLQIQCHHPKCSPFNSDGFFAWDLGQWKHGLRAIYATLQQHLFKVFKSAKMARNSLMVDEDMVRLMARCCFLLLEEECDVFDITQADAEDMDQDGPSRKRQRVSVGLSALLDLFSSTRDIAVAPVECLLQLLSCILREYPQCVPETDIFRVLSELSNLLTRSKINAVIQQSVKCLHSMIVCCKSKDISEGTRTRCLPLWNKAFSALTTIATSCRIPTDESLGLLCEMIRGGVVEPDPSIWSLVLHDSFKISDQALRLLIAALSDVGPVDKLPFWALGKLQDTEVNETLLENYQLRYFLLEQIFARGTTDDIGFLQSNVAVNPGIVCQALLATVSHEGARQFLTSPSSPPPRDLDVLEDCLLRCVFEVPLDGVGAGSRHLDSSSKNQTMMIIRPLFDYLTRKIKLKVRAYLDDVTSENLLFTIKLLAFLVQFLYHCFAFGVLTLDQLLTDSLSQLMKDLIFCVSNGFLVAANDTSTNSQLPVMVKALQAAFCPENSAGDSMNKIISVLLPQEFIERLLQLSDQRPSGLGFMNGASSHRSMNDSFGSDAPSVAKIPVDAIIEYLLSVYRYMMKSCGDSISVPSAFDPGLRILNPVVEMFDSEHWTKEVSLFHVLASNLDWMSLPAECLQQMSSILKTAFVNSPSYQYLADLSKYVPQLFRALLQHQIHDATRVCLKILQRLWMNFASSKPAFLKLAILKCTVEMSQLVPRKLAEETGLDFQNMFAEALASNFLQVRLEAARSAAGLLKDCGDFKARQQLLISMCHSATLPAVSTDLEAHELSDATANLAATYLTAAYYMSEALPKDAAFVFVQAVQSLSYDQTLVSKVMRHFVDATDWKSFAEYRAFVLPRVIHEWLELYRDFPDFPFFLFDTTAQGSVEYWLPEICWKLDPKAWAGVCEKVEIYDLGEIIKQNLSSVIVYFIHVFAMDHAKYDFHTDDDFVADINDLERATALYEALEKLWSVPKHFRDHLDEVIYKVLLKYETDSPYGCPEKVIIATLRYIRKCHVNASGDKKLVDLLNTSDGLQKVLIIIEKGLYNSPNLGEKRRHIHMYRILVSEILASDAKSNQFIIFEIIRRLLQVIDEVSDEEFVLVALNTLADTVAAAFLCKAKAIQMQFHKLARTCLENRALLPAKTILKALFVDHFKHFSDEIAVGGYNDIPLGLEFSKSRDIVERARKSADKSLEVAFQHFMVASVDCEDPFPLKALKKRIRALLPSQLPEMLQSYSTSALFADTISRLINIALCSTKAEVNNLALQCLGECGPVDPSILKSDIVLKRTTVAVKDLDDTGQHGQYKIAFQLLFQFYFEPDINVALVASNVLKRLLTIDAVKQYLGGSHVEWTMPESFFQPFRSAVNIRSLTPAIEMEDIEDIVWFPANSSYESWLKSLMLKLTSFPGLSSFLVYLRPMFAITARFCEEMLPFVIHELLLLNDGVVNTLISTGIRDYFLKHCNISEQNDSRPTTPLYTQNGQGINGLKLNTQSAHLMVDVVLHLRRCGRPDSPTAWSNNFWLDIDYALLAKSAHHCQAYFTTILFAEIWFEQKRRQQQFHEDMVFTQSSQITSSLSDLSSETDQELRSLLLDSHRKLGCPDAVYGYGAGTLSDPSTRIRTYEHEHNFGKAIVTYSNELNQNQHLSTHIGLLRSMHSFGVDEVIHSYLDRVGKQVDDAQLVDFQYEMAWKNCKWNLDGFNGKTTDSFHKSFYNALVCVSDGNFDCCTFYLNSAKDSCLKMIKDCPLETCENVYPILSRLRCLAELENVRSCQGYDRLQNDWASLNAIWSQRHCDIIFNARSSLFDAIVSSTTVADRQELYPVLYQSLISKAKLEMVELKNLERCEVAFAKIRNLQFDSITAFPFEWRIEEAKLFYLRKEMNTAKYMLKKLISEIEGTTEEGDNVHLAEALKTYGCLLTESRSENPDVIYNEILERAVSELDKAEKEGLDVNDRKVDALFTLAQFADEQYRFIDEYMRSPEYEDKQRYIKFGIQLRKLAKANNVEEKKDRYLSVLAKQQSIDQQESNCLEGNKNRYLEQAIGVYLRDVFYLVVLL